jgi:hypothetical protein
MSNKQNFDMSLDQALIAFKNIGYTSVMYHGGIFLMQDVSIMELGPEDSKISDVVFVRRENQNRPVFHFNVEDIRNIHLRRDGDLIFDFAHGVFMTFSK